MSLGRSLGSQSAMGWADQLRSPVSAAPKRAGALRFYRVLWFDRGTRVQTVSAPLVDPTEANSQAQNNAFADAYVPVIDKVFGEANIFADSNLNTIFARKASD